MTGTSAVAAALLCGVAFSQTPGVIQGTAMTAGGKAIARAQLYYGRANRVKGKPTAAVLPPVLSAKVGRDGRFTLSNLPPGAWIVCAVADGYLDPCHWSNAPSFNVTSGHTVTNAEVRMDEAVLLHVRVNDPQGLLANEGKAAGALVQVGVHAPSGAFQRAHSIGKDSKGRDYTVAVPLHGPSNLFVSGGAFQMSDDAGSAVAKGGKLTQLAAPDASNKAGAAGPPVGYTITALGKP